MPIYAYRCASCGHARDVLRKLSDPALTVCPACNASTFEKQLTAAGFQLKGSGWYVTDFRNNGSKPAKPAAAGETKPDTAAKPDAAAPAAPASGTGGDSSTSTAPATPSAPASSA